MKNHITIIGAGNLTESILKAISKKTNLFKINVIDINKKKKNIEKRFNVTFYSTYTDIISKSDFVVLLVKPKDYISVIDKINPFISNKTILLSFMAGITNAQISKILTSKPSIIRCMTNITISDSKSFIFYFMKPFTKIVSNKLEKFLSCFSKAKKCSSQEQIDKITALYGSGPAYYIYFNQIIKDSFIKMGYNKKESILYTNDLLQGTANIIKNNSDSENIIKSIASKGGTTEAALSDLKKNKINQIITKAIIKAHKKSKNILNK